MKNFEEQFEKVAAGCDCDIEVECGNMYCDDCKTIAEYWYHQAFETIMKEIDSRVSPNISEIVKIINKELRE